MTYNPNALAKALRTGSIVLIITDLTKAVSFATAMPSSSYSVMFERAGAVATVLSVASKTTAGFTLGLSAGLNETLKYVAVED